MINYIQDRWMAKVSPKRLALLRIATGGFILWYLVSRFDMLRRMVLNVDAFEPIGVLSGMQQPISAELFQWVLIAMIVLNVLFIAGWKFRITGPAFAVFTFLFFTYRNSWSMIYHNRNILVLHIVILGLVASADAWSLDAWKKKRDTHVASTDSWQYGWPIMLICAVTVSSYLLSGIAKVAGDLSWEWANGSAMRSQIAVDALRKSVLGAETAPLFDIIYEHTWLFLSMGILTFIIELGAPIALLKRPWGKYWAVLALGMHWGIFFIMGIRFRYQMSGLMFLSFFEPEKWFDLAKKRLPPGQEINTGSEKYHDQIILFDGVCNLCNAWVKFVIDKERTDAYQFASLQSESARRMLKQYEYKSNLSSIVLIEDGVLYERSGAALKILGNLRFPWSLIQVFGIIPRPMRDAIYNLIAKYRYTWFGKREECAWMPDRGTVRFIDQ